ncbi:hypothetical protein Csa_009742 [Cucumis sativus]|nr:hypothetical protein Csa_009742 [Cucumis sativus]
MVSPENPNWLFDYGLIEDIPVPDGNFPVASSSFSWPIQPFNGAHDSGVEIDGSLADLDGRLESGSKKRVRSDSCSASSSKACREKLRRIGSMTSTSSDPNQCATNTFSLHLCS